MSFDMTLDKNFTTVLPLLNRCRRWETRLCIKQQKLAINQSLRNSSNLPSCLISRRQTMCALDSYDCLHEANTGQNNAELAET